MNKTPSKFNKGLIGKTLAVGTVAGSIVGAGYLARSTETSLTSSESIKDSDAIWSAMQDNFMVTDARIGELKGELKELKRSQTKSDKRVEDKIMQSEEILRADFSRDLIRVEKQLDELVELLKELGERFGDKLSESTKKILSLLKETFEQSKKNSDSNMKLLVDLIFSFNKDIEDLKANHAFNFDSNTAVMDKVAKLEQQKKDMELVSNELLIRVGKLENKE